MSLRGQRAPCPPPPAPYPWPPALRFCWPSPALSEFLSFPSPGASRRGYSSPGIVVRSRLSCSRGCPVACCSPVNTQLSLQPLPPVLNTDGCPPVSPLTHPLAPGFRDPLWISEPPQKAPPPRRSIPPSTGTPPPGWPRAHPQFPSSKCHSAIPEWPAHRSTEPRPGLGTSVGSHHLAQCPVPSHDTYCPKVPSEGPHLLGCLSPSCPLAALARPGVGGTGLRACSQQGREGHRGPELREEQTPAHRATWGPAM